MKEMLIAVLDSFLRAIIRFWDNRFLRNDEVDYLRDRNAELLGMVLGVVAKTAQVVEPETDSIEEEFQSMGKPIETTTQRRKRLERDSLAEWNRLVQEASEKKISSAKTKSTEELEAEVLKGKLMALDFGSYLNKEQPQENQFLTGNPATQPNAQTSWMNPDTSDWGKYSGDISGGLQRPPQQNTPPANGTALGAISAGQVGNSAPQQTPLGFDAGKWGDPNKHDPKYDAGHMLASGKSLEEIGNYIQSKYPGYKYLGGDKIQGDDGMIYDFSFGSKAGINAPMWEQVGGGNGQQQGFMGGGNQQNSFMQMLMQMLMGGNMMGNSQGNNRFMPTPGRDLPNQQFNPSGGYIPPSGNTGFAGGVDRGVPVQQPFGQPTPDANGYYGGWTDQNGVRHSGNQPGMSYLT